MHNSKGEELTEYEAKGYLESAYPEFKSIEIRDKPDLRINTENGIIGVEVVTSYPSELLRDMNKHGNTNKCEYDFEHFIILRFCEKQKKAKEYEALSDMRLFVISICPLIFQDEHYAQVLLDLLMKESDNTFSAVYLMILSTLYEFDLIKGTYRKVKEFDGEQAQIAMQAKRKWEQG